MLSDTVRFFPVHHYWYVALHLICSLFFFQAEDGIRDLVRSRGLGDVYKRQIKYRIDGDLIPMHLLPAEAMARLTTLLKRDAGLNLSLIHI